MEEPMVAAVSEVELHQALIPLVVEADFQVMDKLPQIRVMLLLARQRPGRFSTVAWVASSKVVTVYEMTVDLVVEALPRGVALVVPVVTRAVVAIPTRAGPVEVVPSTLEPTNLTPWVTPAVVRLLSRFSNPHLR